MRALGAKETMFKLAKFSESFVVLKYVFTNSRKVQYFIGVLNTIITCVKAIN